MMLRRQFANRRFDTEKYVYYRDRADHYRAMVLALKEATADLNEVFFRRNAQRPAHEIAQYARKAFDRHQHLVELYDDPNISYIVFLLELNIYLAVKDYSGVIEVANQAISYLNGRPGTLPKMVQVFEANLSVAYTQQNDYENGRAFALRLLERTGPEEHNYIKVYELLLLLSLRAGKFQEAYATFRSIHPATLRRDILSYYRETFRIIEAYLYLLIQLCKIQIDADDTHFQNFRISRFLNSFLHATSEKSHRNVHLLIIEIIDNVINERHGRTSYSIEAINKYAQRHLKGSGHERIRYFLKALSQLSVQQYHRTAVERHTSRYIQRMKQHRLEETKLDYYMELVPFETLWELILERLGFRRIRKSAKRGR
jgi:tetratricopeptide (TPR) repeat protein